MNKNINMLSNSRTLIKSPWVNPKMTSMTLPIGTVINAPTSRLHQGSPWAMYSTSDYCIYYRGYGGVEAPYTDYYLKTGTYAYLTKILPMVGNGDYIKGSQCYCDIWLDAVQSTLGLVYFSYGVVLNQPVKFNRIRFYSFGGGGHGDLVGWNAFPLEGYQVQYK